jgi:mannose-6-phosphate isomerase-like protein (cupin superfamily)
MDEFSRKIWKDLPPEREEIPRATRAQKAKDAPPQADHWPAPILLERAAYLRKLAKHGDGQASETLKEYPLHSTMLSFRARNGVAELHEKFADLFYVLDGRATLVTGGTVVGAETIGPGEVRAVNPSRAACVRNCARATWRMCPPACPTRCLCPATRRSRALW